MTLDVLKPREALNKAFLKSRVHRSSIDLFKTNLIRLLDRSNDVESEEYHKNLVSDFLKRTFYNNAHFINTKGRNDLVIHKNSEPDSPVTVIIEAKKPTNNAEMLSTTNVNKKAFHELILYYLRERISNNNLEVKHLVATNVYEWFIFDVSVFEKLFGQNKQLIELFLDFENGRLVKSTTDFFYREIAAPAVKAVHDDISFAHFDLLDYEEALRNSQTNDDRALVPLFKLLSPEHLLKLPFSNDSNTLDTGFYRELLHLIGLVDVKKGAKRLICRKPDGKRDAGSLIENTILQLDSMQKVFNFDDITQYGDTYEEQLFNIALELVINWVNRLIFLKLLEAQLLSYHEGNPEHSFLTLSKISNYDDLNALFFAVLGRESSKRNKADEERFGRVPYLNSSLFELSAIENETIVISNLRDDTPLPILSSTVLKDQFGRKRSGEISTLEYILEFLEAYDFSSEGSDAVQEENKKLINASVLGLIFEKLNGYKDGSFFTPGYITMYMCREVIRRAVLEKFNVAKGWACQSLEELYDRIDDKQEANKIINDLKICDPAVGSGHFLVSALNEILALKSYLKVLLDDEGKTLRDYNIEVENDDLVVTDDDGNLFEYRPKSKESQRVQQTLFREKRTIIENCLFGVDINHNSVRICRLRLWIELLKHSYYLDDGALETLPNIDINIKCRNSLVSRFSLDEDLSKALKTQGLTISNYQDAIKKYQSATIKEEKKAMEALIESIKDDFRDEIEKNDPMVRKLRNLEGNRYKLVNQEVMFAESREEKAARRAKIKKFDDSIKKFETSIERIRNNKIYKNAFEWRFEFPEVLNDRGDFVGFDCVISNPPYGLPIKGAEREALVAKLGKVPDFEIYYWFINCAHALLKDRGTMAYITPNTILFNVFAREYRLGLFDAWRLDEVLDCTNFSVFSDATVRNVIFILTKGVVEESLKYRPTSDATSFDALIDAPLNSVSKSVVESNNQNWGLIFKLPQSILELVQKIRQKTTIKDYFDVSQGYIPYRRSDLVQTFGKEKGDEIVDQRLWHSDRRVTDDYKEEIWGEGLSRYDYRGSGSFVKYGEHLATYVDEKFFTGPRLLIREITNPNIIGCLVEEEFVNDPQIISVIKKNCSYSLEALWVIINSKLSTFFHFNSSPKATKGAFPKILVGDVNDFPLPPVGKGETIAELERLVREVRAKKVKTPDSDTSKLEKQMDQLVYNFYGLNSDDISKVESS